MKYSIVQTDNVVTVTPTEGEVKVYPNATLIEKKKRGAGVVIVENTLAKNPIDFFRTDEIETVVNNDEEA